MGKKYIIEIPEDKIEDFVGSTHFLMPYMMAGHIGHHDTGLPIEPYTEPDLEQVRKEAYEDGLKDAWEAAKKIASDDAGQNHVIFGQHFANVIFNTFTASEAIEKIRQYEQEQDAEIKVGDEVVGVFSDGKETRSFVFMRGTQEYYFGMYSDTGEFCRTVRLNLRKTGRHFPEIAAVLRKMRGEQE